MSETNVLLVLIYADWCGHCKKYLGKQEPFIDSWSNVTKKLKEYNEFNTEKINLDTLKLEDKLLKEILNLTNELAKNNSSNDLQNLYNQLLKDTSINYNIDYSSLKDKVEGYPTLILLRKEGKKFVALTESFSGDRTNPESLKKYIINCCKNKQEGGKSINKYRNKYKKYKQMYRELLNKQNGGGDYKTKYLKYKKLYLKTINK